MPTLHDIRKRLCALGVKLVEVAKKDVPGGLTWWSDNEFERACFESIMYRDADWIKKGTTK
jgi:hypothetical protein